MTKLVFDATCGGAPALATLGGRTVVAWPGGGGLGGAEPNLKINLLEVDPYEGQAILDGLQVTDETTQHRPGLVEHDGLLRLAWTGTDGVGRVNVASLKDVGAPLDNVRTLPWTSVSGPTLMSYDGLLVMVFAGGGGLGGAQPNGKINFAWSVDGENWPEWPQLVLDTQTSWHTSALAPYVATAGPDAELLWAFTGVDNKLYVHHAYEQRFDQFGDRNAEQAPPEESFAGPAMASHTFDLSDWAYRVVFAGNDAERHLYETGGEENNWLLGYRRSYTDCSQFEPAIVHHPTRGGQDDWIYAWAGTDAVHRLNIAGGQDLVDRHVPEDDWYQEHTEPGG